MLAREAKLGSGDAFGLLAYYGKESAGAITLLSHGEAQAESGYRPLSDAALHERIARLPRQSRAAGAPSTCRTPAEVESLPTPDTATRAAERRVLDQIRIIVIREMAARLRQ